jgi:hypothetical protein
MSNIKLWVDDYNDDEKDEKIENIEREIENEEEDVILGDDDIDIICVDCGALVEDGIQCQICGLIVGI